MPLKKKQKLAGLLVLLDMLLDLVSYIMALVLRMKILSSISNSAEYASMGKSFLVAFFSAAVMVILYYIFGVYESLLGSLKKKVVLICAANGVGLLFASTILFLFRLTDYSRLALGLYYVISCLLVSLRQLVTQQIMKHQQEKGIGTIRVILVGSGEMAKRYYDVISAGTEMRYNCIGYFAERENPDIPGYQGKLDGLRQALVSNLADAVVIAPGAEEQEKTGDLIALCGRYGISANVIPAYNDFIPATPQVETLGNLKLIGVRSAANRNGFWLFAKRLMDIVLSFAALIVLSPLMLVTAVIIKVTSPGPVLFRQIRAGKNGKPFNMYKFRSMCVDAEKQLQNLQMLNESDGPTFKIAHDPRITPFGKFIRRTSIDELPQLANILKGDMSIVGPRPPLMNEIAQYSDWDWGRLAVKPGLTCYWQISGRSDLSFAEWMQLDLKYVEEQGFWTDVKIVLKTIRTVFTGRGAY